jgi:hypothetical protein
MHLLYTDEVNIDPASSDFFIYAGVSISDNNAGALSKEIDSLRSKYSYRSEDILKFNTRERPKHILPEDHRDIKREVLKAAARHEVMLFSSIISHNIATSPEDARRNEINRICYHFDCYLRRKNDFGLVLIDTFQDSKLSKILREKFSVGIKGLPYSPVYRLERILGFHLASIGSSNFCSIVDIVLGSFRYSINSRFDPQKLPTVGTLLGQLNPLCIKTRSGKIDELSVFFSPKRIKAHIYLAEYKALHIFLAENGFEAEQEPSNGYS